MVLEFLQSFYVYPFIFFGLIFGGEVILLPAIFLASTGYLNMVYVVLIALTATTLSDILWYLLGRYLTKEKLYKLPVLKNRKDLADKLSTFFEKHDLKIMVAAKYIYGIRIIVQIIAGMHNMKFGRYLAVNMFAIAAFLGILVLISSTIATSLSVFEDITSNLITGLTIFAVIVVCSHILIKKWITKQKWFR